jgi:hypothetical protein
VMQRGVNDISLSLTPTGTNSASRGRSEVDG